MYKQIFSSVLDFWGEKVKKGKHLENIYNERQRRKPTVLGKY